MTIKGSEGLLPLITQRSKLRDFDHNATYSNICSLLLLADLSWYQLTRTRVVNKTKPNDQKIIDHAFMTYFGTFQYLTFQP